LCSRAGMRITKSDCIAAIVRTVCLVYFVLGFISSLLQLAWE
jgi:hypothetical protein